MLPVSGRLMKGTVRRRYSLLVSLLYILVGLFIVVRSLLSVVVPVALLGLVFVALGAVRIRDYLAWRGGQTDS